MNDNEKNQIEPGTLYLVATPVGNLADLSQRAVKILAGVDFIAAEDTRTSAKLLACAGVCVKPMTSYHDHNEYQRAHTIIDRLKKGESCAVVTDAGTPGISDPGADIARKCIDAGLRVTCVPGACAAICALVISGFDTDRFCFEGFVSGTNSERRERFFDLKNEKRTCVVYEAPHRLVSTLTLMRECLGDSRQIALCREMTKLNEEVERVSVGEACEIYSQKEPRGEYVIVISGAPSDRSNEFWADMTVEEHVSFYCDRGLSKMDAVKSCAHDRGVGKNEIYKALL